MSVYHCLLKYLSFQHGRLKVRTSAEEAARKQKEREQKAKAFRAGMGRILMKKVTDELDDEMMQLTGKILSANPDVATLWNLRRRCILKVAETEPYVKKMDLYYVWRMLNLAFF